MKTLFLKSTSVLVLMGVMGSALAFPPLPPPPAPQDYYVQNYTSTSYTATGTWPHEGFYTAKTVPADNYVRFRADGSWASFYEFDVTVSDNKGNSCSAEAENNGKFEVHSNPNASAAWTCVADGTTLKVLPTS